MALKAPRSHPWRRIGILFSLLGGGALAFVAANSPVSWGMIVGSGVELGGEAGQRWLMNLTEGLMALGVIAGGRLVDSKRLVHALIVALSCLTLGVVIGWRGHLSSEAVIIGLGLMASFGSGMMMALSVVVVTSRAPKWNGACLGIATCSGLVLVELIWGSASMLSLSRGAAWVLGQVAWIGPLCGALGGTLLIVADRLTSTEPKGSSGDLSSKILENRSFLIIAVLALVTSFVGLMSQRAGAALSLIGLPEGSFASGVLVGFTFAMARAGGAVIGGVLHDVVGPRFGTLTTAFAIAVMLVVLSLFSGYENPWHLLIGSMGFTCGLGLTIVPLACAKLLGMQHLGYSYGFLYLAIALGNVLVLPLQGVIEGYPRGVLIVTAALCVGIGVSARWLRPANP